MSCCLSSTVTSTANVDKAPRTHKKPCFEGQIEAAIFEATEDGVVDIKTSVEPLHLEAEEREGENRSHWDNLLSHTISVDGERIPGKLLHQCSLEHGFVKARESEGDTSEDKEEIQDKDSEECLRTERSLVEQELRRQWHAPSDVSIRDLLAKPPVLEAEDEEEEVTDTRKNDSARETEKAALQQPVVSSL
ncbi:unnamed protein product [Schistocephalus solidus]|uniref:Uncharacterized protein n=1 Tax=Schistocephalus solidus TaxID=70667 RepID=A0A183T8L8_SCHSO|nr:unnamed protein product [Schistocephalus solidus]